MLSNADEVMMTYTQVDIELCGKLRKELGRDNNPRIPMCVFHGGRKQFKFNHKTSFFAKYYI
mgnify:CR=1 FL=1